MARDLRRSGMSKNSICHRVWVFFFPLENLGSNPCFAIYQDQMEPYNESLLEIKMLDVGVPW